MEMSIDQDAEGDTLHIYIFGHAGSGLHIGFKMTAYCGLRYMEFWILERGHRC